MSARPSLRSVIFSKATVYWVLGTWLIVNEALFVPPRDFRIAVFVGGMLIAGVPGWEIARALWPGSPVEPPSPPSPSPPASSPTGTSGATSGP